MKFMAKLYSLKIAIKISLLSFTAILAVLILGATYFYGEVITSTELEKQSEFAHLTELIQKVEINALQMRRNEKDFLLRKDVKYVEKFSKSVDKMEELLSEISTLKLSDSLAQNVKHMQAGIKKHNEQFNKVYQLKLALGLDEKSGHQGKLRKAVHEVETNLKELRIDPLTIKMLMMRRHEKDFILRGKSKYIARIDKRVEEFKVLLDEALVSIENKQKLSGLIESYRNHFTTYANVAIQIKPEIKKLSKNFKELTPDFDAILKSSKLGEKAIKANVVSKRSFVKNLFIGSALFVLILSAGLGLLIGRSITGPIKVITNAMQRLANGDTSKSLAQSEENNEIGDMARAVEVFKRNSIRNKELEAEAAERQKKIEKRSLAVEHLNENFDAEMSKVLSVLESSTKQLNDTAQDMSNATEDTKTQSDLILGSAEQSAENVQSVASATEELSASIQEIGRQTVDSSNMSSEAVKSAEGAKTYVTKLVENSQNIGAVLNLISEIAEQTNLLALNATIEAARAGEMGKGFAVVANEVKSLASQTAKATEEIGTQIESIQSISTSTELAIDEIVVSISNVDEVINIIASAIEEQNSATLEIAKNLQQASESAATITTNVNGVNEAANVTSSSAGLVIGAVNDLSEQSDNLKNQIDSFIKNVRVA